MVHQVGCVLAEPAQACLRPEAGFQFTHAPAGVRTKLGLSEEQEESVGIFISSTIPGARVLADVHQRTVTLECWEPLPPPLVLLIPEDPALPPRLAEATVTDETAQVRFDNIPAGRYLLSIYTLEEEHP